MTILADPGAAAPPRHAARRLSDLLGELARSGEERVTVAGLAGRLGERSFAPLMVLLSLPNLVFFLPGSSVITGLPLIFVSVQLVAGMPSLWLPRAIGERGFDGAAFAKVVDAALPHVRRVERLARPRWWPASPLLAERVVGLASLVMATFMFLPIPFANSMPALAVILLAVALSERDGLWLTLGLAFSALSTLLAALMVLIGFQAILGLLG